MSLSYQPLSMLLKEGLYTDKIVNASNAFCYAGKAYANGRKRTLHVHSALGLANRLLLSKVRKNANTERHACKWNPPGPCDEHFEMNTRTLQIQGFEKHSAVVAILAILTVTGQFNADPRSFEQLSLRRRKCGTLSRVSVSLKLQKSSERRVSGVDSFRRDWKILDEFQIDKR